VPPQQLIAQLIAQLMEFALRFRCADVQFSAATK